ncbi:oxidoreductase [Paracoccus tegillarcae]|uniref:Oxidoreductase n=1 Tax=Paracoccus tegillarcae TaxID=1529068 RepID=A0A2K9EK21_9RHOB|nr:oxidoreductase [Paracoccus tegillarcae]
MAVVGAGLIGRRHGQAMLSAPGVVLAGIADPDPNSAQIAADFDVPWHAGLDDMIAAGGIDGIILATPNQLHEEGALAAIAAGLPVLVEKPLASDLAAARRMVVAAQRAGVALATGHHRRHNPLVEQAKQLITDGRLGRIVSVHVSAWLSKPDTYFDVDWRRRKGAGPVYLNLIHDIDLMLHLAGPVTQVQAMESNANRGNEVEDTANVLLQFACGALGTMAVSDTVTAPLSWELTAGENPAYPVTGQDCYWIAGTQASLALPSLTLWANPDQRGWWEPISATHLPVEHGDPLPRQLAQFGRVVRGEQAPLVSGEDGLAAMILVDAIKRAAATGERVSLAT